MGMQYFSWRARAAMRCWWLVAGGAGPAVAGGAGPAVAGGAGPAVAGGAGVWWLLA